MTTLTIDEITRNAILAALDERAARLNAEVKRLHTWTGRAQARPDVIELTEDAQRALVWNIAALHETNMARLQVAEAESIADHAEQSSWTEAEKAGAWGR